MIMVKVLFHHLFIKFEHAECATLHTNVLSYIVHS